MCPARVRLSAGSQLTSQAQPDARCDLPRPHIRSACRRSLGHISSTVGPRPTPCDLRQARRRHQGVEVELAISHCTFVSFLRKNEGCPTRSAPRAPQRAAAPRLGLCCRARPAAPVASRAPMVSLFALAEALSLGDVSREVCKRSELCSRRDALSLVALSAVRSSPASWPARTPPGRVSAPFVCHCACHSSASQTGRRRRAHSAPKLTPRVTLPFHPPPPAARARARARVPARRAGGRGAALPHSRGGGRRGGAEREQGLRRRRAAGQRLAARRAALAGACARIGIAGVRIAPAGAWRAVDATASACRRRLARVVHVLRD